MGLSNVRKSLDPPRRLADGDAARLVLVPSEARPGDVLYERVAPVVNRMIWLYLATFIIAFGRHPKWVPTVT